MTRMICSALLVAALASCGTRGPEGPTGPVGPVGPTGPGFMTGASISTVVPAAVTQGSEYDVTISGFATEWNDMATASFGQGITVTRVKAASATSLLVHLRVAPDAMTDTRDVSVTQAMSTVQWRNAFSVLPRVKFTAFGTASQMSLSVVRLEVNEPAFEFDTSTSSGRFVGVSVSATPDLPLQVLSLSSKVLDVLVLADADAGIQAHDLSIVSREGTFAERTFTAPQVVTVTPRQSADLVDGTPANGSIDKPFQSVTYRYEPTAPDAGMLDPIIISVASSSTTVAPKVAVVPGSGLWTSLLNYATTTSVTPVAGVFYWLVVFDASGGSGFTYTLSTARVMRTREEEPNDVFGQARASTVPGIVGPMELASLTDVDWVKITAGAADVGKRFHVVTQPGDADTDTLVEVFRTDGTTTLGGESSDFDFHEDHLSAAIPVPGDYYVKVSVSPFMTVWSALESHYDLLITIE